jgi:signal transduction histidine kinase
MRAKSPFLLNTGRVIAAVVLVFSSALILEHVLDLDLGIDTRFFHHRMSDWTSPLPPGRPSLPAALAFFFAGVGAISSQVRRAGRLSDWCATLVAVISYLTLIGYVYGLAMLYDGAMESTAFLLVLVSATLFTMRAEPGIAQIIVSGDAGGMIFRNVVVAIVLLMPVLGLLEIRAENNFLISSQLGIALLVVMAVFIFTAITAHTATKLNFIDSKRKQAEEQLVRSEKLAAAGRLSATIAHEVNNPLASLMNLLFLAESAESPEKTHEYIRSAESEVQRASAMTKRALGFYKDEINPQQLNLRDLVSDILSNEFRGTLSHSGIKVNTRFHSPGAIYARAGEIRQIIGNLVGNAVDALQNSNRPQITLTIRENSGDVELSVDDNGCGVPQENIEKIFTPFFTTKRDVGTGLGLYISRQLAQKNGGTLRVDGSTGNGSGASFSLVLPLAPATLAVGAKLTGR